jgi:threonine dehydrogenase-like Zn-dependent dehydrogenase
VAAERLGGKVVEAGGADRVRGAGGADRVGSDGGADRVRGADSAGRLRSDGGAGAARDHDVVIDAAGTQASLDLAIERVRPGGTVVVVATFWSPVEIGHALLGKEVRLVPAFTYGHHGGRREFEQAAAILAGESGIPDAIVTHRLPLAEAPRAFQLAADRRSGAIKVLIEP